MPANVRIFNESDTSLNYDTYLVHDNISGRSFQTNPVQGGQYSDSFDCAGDSLGNGDVDVTNLQSGVPNNFPSVRDNQDLPM
jgi:hypothetical protein